MANKNVPTNTETKNFLIKCKDYLFQKFNFVGHKIDNGKSKESVDNISEESNSSSIQEGGSLQKHFANTNMARNTLENSVVSGWKTADESLNYQQQSMTENTAEGVLLQKHVRGEKKVKAWLASDISNEHSSIRYTSPSNDISLHTRKEKTESNPAQTVGLSECKTVRDSWNDEQSMFMVNSVKTSDGNENETDKITTEQEQREKEVLYLQKKVLRLQEKIRKLQEKVSMLQGVST